MSLDINALKTEIETNPRYTQLAIDGNHAEIARLFNEDKPATTEPAVRLMQEVLDAIAVAWIELNSTQQGSITGLMSGSETSELDFANTNSVNAIKSVVNQGASAPSAAEANANLDIIGVRQASYVDEFGAISVSHQQVSEATRTMSGSALQAYLDPASDVAKQPRAAIITDYGVKIRRIRDEGGLVGQPFVDWRNSIYAIQGVDRDDTDTLRMAAIDDKMTEVGIS